jgi:SAM-dependent MidA family methyltransferase
MTLRANLHESAHAARVAAHLRQCVDHAGGFLPFDRYMQEALYAPGLGYYSAGARKLGAGGDFTTAPELSGLFGQCLAVQCAQVLRQIPQGEILEVGAGSGVLAAQILEALAAHDRLPTHYRILEVSADLRERQVEKLSTLAPEIASRVQWIDQPPERAWSGVLLANEVLDALPCERFVWRDERVLEWGVTLNAEEEFIGVEREAPVKLRDEVLRIRSELKAAWPPGYTSELCLGLSPWLQSVTQSLNKGLVLLIDYGLPRRELYHPARERGSLRCHYRHRAHVDPFAYPGMQDITAWVDFTRVAEAADAAALEVLGYSTQMALLLALGIEQAVISSASPVEQARRASEARRLLMPEEMGETFKAIALGRGFNEPLMGFALQDLRSRL